VRTSNISKSNVIFVKRMMNGKNHRRGQSIGTSLRQKMLITLIKPDRGATEMTIGGIQSWKTERGDILRWTGVYPMPYTVFT
jgi:hypothetical protein